jgi:hypothetical protein
MKKGGAGEIFFAEARHSASAGRRSGYGGIK